jgi:hypothetical protein
MMDEPARAFDGLLDEARQAAEKALERLEVLYVRFPDDLPLDLIECLRQFHAGPATVLRHDHADQRAAPRFPCRYGLVRILPDNPDHDVRVGLLLDQCWSGVALFCAQPLPVGCIIHLKQKDGSDAGLPPWAGVRHCHRHASGWVVGCQFLPDPEQGQRAAQPPPGTG